MGRPARNATHKRCRRGCDSAVKAPEHYIQACPVLFRRGFLFFAPHRSEAIGCGLQIS